MRFLRPGSLLLAAALRSSAAFTLAKRASYGAASKTTCRSSLSTFETPTTQPTSLEASSKAYRELLTKLREITHLKQAQAVLNYDQMVFLPRSEGASAARGAQLAALASVIHSKATDPSIKQLLETAEADLMNYDGTIQDEKTILELTREDFEKNERIPSDLEAKRASLQSSAYAAWVKARADNNFSSFEPVLKECFDTAAEVAEAIRGADSTTPLYTQMLDEFERGMPSERIDAIFNEIEESLSPLISKVLASDSKPDISCLEGTFDISAQERVSRQIVKALGYDDAQGRIDVSVHPFTMSMSPADVRITSRFNENEWIQGLCGSVHESGHAMYEQNLENSDLSVDTFLSMGCHESQSLFFERHVLLSRPFWKFATPILKGAFGGEWDAEEVYQAVNAVSPSLIRVEADELTYPLHVILRYKIERAVVEGKMDVHDIPRRWNEEMKEMLGVDVPSDAQGCLQDVHWSGLAIGYFPTYLLGSATAAQLAHYCKQDIPDFDEKVARGEFGEIKAWLTEKVHKHGRRYPSLDALLEDQLGEKLNPRYFIDYLTEKYTELYKC